MTVYVVIWVVLMMFWLFGGGYAVYTGPSPNPVYFGTYTLIPWLCVLILGLIVFGAIGGGSTVIIR
jgi:hypothetical protein